MRTNWIRCRTKAVVSLLCVPAIALGGVSVANATETPAGSASVRSAALHTDARTVFRGALFAQGPVGAIVAPDAPKATPAQAAAVDQLMTALDKRYPGTVESVSTAIGSRSPSRVAAALDTASSRIQRLVGSDRTATALLRPNCILLLVAVAAAVYLYVTFATPAGVEPNSQRQLQRDTEVRQLVTSVH